MAKSAEVVATAKLALAAWIKGEADWPTSIIEFAPHKKPIIKPAAAKEKQYESFCCLVKKTVEASGWALAEEVEDNLLSLPWG